MAFSCISHILTNFTAATQTVLKPNHTGLIHRASLPTNPPSTFPPAPNQPTTAFAPNLVSGAAFRERMQEILSGPRTPEQTEAPNEDRGEDGTSWMLANKDIDGWDVGQEKATQMFVKRKGRGNFRFEDAMMEGWGVGLRGIERGHGVMEEGNKDKDEEVMDRRERLEDGFGYRGWVDEEIERNSRVENRNLGEREMVRETVEGGDGVHAEVEGRRRNGVEGRRDSVRQDNCLEAGLEQ